MLNLMVCKKFKASRFYNWRFLILIFALSLGLLGVWFIPNEDSQNFQNNVGHKAIQENSFEVKIAKILKELSKTLLTVSFFELFMVFFVFNPMSAKRKKYINIFCKGNESQNEEAFLLVFPDWELDYDLLPKEKTSKKQELNLGRDSIYSQTNEIKISHSESEKHPLIRTKIIRNINGCKINHTSVSSERVSALQDLKSLVYVASFLGDMSKKMPEIYTDTDIVDRDMFNNNLIIFGLFSNYLTEVSEEMNDQNFFSFDREGKKWRLIIKSSNKENLKCKCKESNSETGLDKDDEYEDNDDIDYGLIAKLYPKHYPEKTWIIVAGIGGYGTQGAGKYLFENWEKIYDLKDNFGNDIGSREFAAVLSIPKKIGHKPHIVQCIVKSEDKTSILNSISQKFKTYVKD